MYKGILLGRDFTEQFTEIYTVQGIAYWNDTGCLNFGSTLPSSPTPQHTPTFSIPDITRIPASGRRGGTYLGGGGRGKETERDGGGRVREEEGGREKRVDQNTNCLYKCIQHKISFPNRGME